MKNSWIPTGLTGLVLLLTACSAELEAPARPAVAVDSQPSAASSDRVANRMPAALRQAFIAERMAEADGRYDVTRLDDGELVAVQPHTRMRSGFRATGVRLGTWSEDGDARGRPGVSLAFGGLGRKGALLPVEGVTPRSLNNRVEYVRDEVLEWYLNGPLGLEQGFDIAHRPAGSGELEVRVSLGGEWTPRQVGDRIEFTDSSGRVRASYSDLFAIDATGAVLPARLELDGSELDLVVQDAAARYPVRIDPLIVLLQSKLLPAGASQVGNFGFAVALTADGALIGAYGDDHDYYQSGAVYWFTQLGTSTWRLAQKITPSDPAEQKTFGYALASSGDWLAVGAPGSAPNAPAVYLFQLVEGVWVEQQKVIASDGPVVNAFGKSVSMDGTTLVVGAPTDDGPGFRRGAVYVLEYDGAAWVHHSKVTVPSAVDNDAFGHSVSVSGDLILVGAPHDTGTQETGSAYVFWRAGNLWLQQDRFQPADLAGNDDFGWSVMLDGYDAIVGAPGADGPSVEGTGAAYVYTRTAVDPWSLQAKLTASDGARLDGFGVSVFLNQDTAAVGAPWDDGDLPAYGSAYAFVRSGTTWTEQAKLTASEPREMDRLGIAVAILGDTLFAGAELDDDAAYDSGSVYVFQRDGIEWTEARELYPTMLEDNAFLGESIAIDGDTVAVGAPGSWAPGNQVEGSVRVFVRIGNQWREQAVVVPSDSAPGNYFGWSVALSGDTLIVGAERDDENGLGAGAAYVFTRTGDVWTEQQKLMPDGPASGAGFGWRMALSGNTLTVGAPDDDGAESLAGAAYVYVFDGQGWVRQARLTASDGVTGAQLGRSVALDGDLLVVGAQGDDDAVPYRGAAYVFTRSGGVWTEQAKLTASDGAQNSFFGCSAAIAQDYLVIGAYKADHPVAGAEAGAAYLFVNQGDTWVEQTRLDAPDPEALASFGRTVVLEGDVMAIGAYTDGAGGSVYLYTLNQGAWSLQHRQTFWGSGPGRYFGFAIDLDSDALAVGEPGSYSSGASAGAAYVFQIAAAGDGAVCPGPFTCASGFCVDGVCCDTACGGGAADDCTACSVAAGAAQDGVCGPADGWACDDGDACTMEDTCANGACAGVPLDGDADGHVAETCGGDDCDDGSANVNPEIYEGGAGTAVCADGLDNDCDGLTDLAQAACQACSTDADCDDGDPCNGVELCTASVCVIGSPLDCDDSDVCTDDTCDPASGCVHTNNTAACDDGDACTDNDTCSAGTCTGDPVDCHDGDPCTEDACDPATGCVHAPDPDCCFSDDDCDDGDGCTTDVCDPASHTCDHPPVESCGGGSGSSGCATLAAGRGAPWFGLLLGLFFLAGLRAHRQE